MKLSYIIRLSEARTAKYVVPAALRAENPMIKNPNPHGRGKEVKFMSAYNAAFGTAGSYDMETRGLFKKAVVNHIKLWEKKKADPVSKKSAPVAKSPAKAVAKVPAKKTTTASKTAPATKLAAKTTPAKSTSKTGKYDRSIFNKGHTLVIPTKKPKYPIKMTHGDDVSHTTDIKTTMSGTSRNREPFSYTHSSDPKTNAKFMLTYADDAPVAVFAKADMQEHVKAINEGMASVLGPLGMRLNKLTLHTSKTSNGQWTPNNEIKLNKKFLAPDSAVQVGEQKLQRMFRTEKRDRTLAHWKKAKSSPAIERNIEVLSTIKEFSCSSNYDTFLDRLRSVTCHEAGHALFYSGQLMDTWTDALEKNNASMVDAAAVSEYGSSSYTELFAETTAFIHMGRIKEVPDTILASYIECIDKLEKDIEAGPGEEDPKVRGQAIAKSMKFAVLLGQYRAKDQNTVIDRMKAVLAAPGKIDIDPIEVKNIEHYMSKHRAFIDTPIDRYSLESMTYSMKTAKARKGFKELDKLWNDTLGAQISASTSSGSSSAPLTKPPVQRVIALAKIGSTNTLKQTDIIKDIEALMKSHTPAQLKQEGVDIKRLVSVIDNIEKNSITLTNKDHFDMRNSTSETQRRAIFMSLVRDPEVKKRLAAFIPKFRKYIGTIKESAYRAMARGMNNL